MALQLQDDKLEICHCKWQFEKQKTQQKVYNGAKENSSQPHKLKKTAKKIMKITIKIH